MAQRLPFDTQDRAALRALDHDFTISADGETARITGEMEVRLRFKFPSDELLDVKIRRAQLLEQLDIASAQGKESLK